MKYILMLLVNLGSYFLHAQVGGRCEGCEAALEYNPNLISNVDILPGFEQNEPKLILTGTVFKKDGKTPASDVVLYVYHTNRDGVYPPAPNATGWGRRHGKHRGWIKTDKDGKYTFYTFRPASYPNRDEPEHIHITVKEPGVIPYYIDDYLFDDDPLLTSQKRQRLRNRGGVGIVKSTEFKDDLIHIKRDIILGLNIPNYR
ncbi:intradiol ring-cleavage dioxygenase [Ekhidna sp.]|uniref:dioxygenase family protein n=1 Tax=Ekhidna sp. TaxID=2608089 RepID=UPI003B50661B